MADKQTQWSAFLRKSRVQNTPDDFAEIAVTIATFLAQPEEPLNGVSLEDLLERMTTGGSKRTSPSSRIWRCFCISRSCIAVKLSPSMPEAVCRAAP